MSFLKYIAIFNFKTCSSFIKVLFPFDVASSKNFDKRGRCFKLKFSNILQERHQVMSEDNVIYFVKF
jgi:hypothetical protein